MKILMGKDLGNIFKDIRETGESFTEYAIKNPILMKQNINFHILNILKNGIGLFQSENIY